jgi:hypothetical protein
LSHEGITFIKGSLRDLSSVSPETVAAIAAGLNLLLPKGDFIATNDGRLEFTHSAPSTWFTDARLTAVERDPR